MIGPNARRRALPLLAALAAGALLAGLGVLAVLPASWSVALAGQSTPAQTADPVPIRVVAPSPTTRSPAPRPVPAPVAAPVAEAVAAVQAPTITPTSTTRPAPAPPTTDIPVATGPAARVVALTNVARERAGCDPLQPDDRVTAAAQAHSADMAARGYFAHDSLDGRDFSDRLRAAGYPEPGAENIAMGQETADDVVAAWLDSPGHRRNIEDCSLRTIGVGYDPDGAYWTQDFGR
ncbi:CAP domain-containing protein [Pseudonocardia xishanensis]|uniref:SCP domain-containing protein n=1 Tax=Pseudonocardia xishanensis TaxID=630995 RepID=A0ABP8RW25_9PSEU